MRKFVFRSEHFVKLLSLTQTALSNMILTFPVQQMEIYFVLVHLVWHVVRQRPRAAVVPGLLVRQITRACLEYIGPVVSSSHTRATGRHRFPTKLLSITYVRSTTP